MTERVWFASQVRPKLENAKEHRLVWKVQNYNNPGLPDALCCFNGVVCLIETKYTKKLPVRDTSFLDLHLSQEQYRHLAAWTEAKGLAYVLLGVEQGKQWFLLRASDVYQAALRGGWYKQEMIDAAIMKQVGTASTWQTLSDIPAEIMQEAKAHAV